MTVSLLRWSNVTVCKTFAHRGQGLEIIFEPHDVFSLRGGDDENQLWDGALADPPSYAILLARSRDARRM